MNLSGDAHHEYMRTAAQQAVLRYAQDIVDVETLTYQIEQEWQLRSEGEELPSSSVLARMAQRLCSRALYEAWHASDETQRNHAYENLRRYLGKILLHTRYAEVLQSYTGAAEDVLHQTLEVLQQLLRRNSHAGPDDPAAFLKWTQTILYRQAQTFLEQFLRVTTVSLDEQPELFAELFVDTSNQDPLEHVLSQELRQALGNAILSMRNPRYRSVLIYTYLAGLSDYELAERLNAQVQEIYLWRYRALKMLRSRPDVIQLLRSLVE